MTREDHYKLCCEHRQNALDAIRELQKNVPAKKKADLWDDYRRESKLANKHFGIAQAMHTREMKRKYGEHFDTVI